jgi:hypothetical protein
MPYELRKQDGGYKVGKKGSNKTFSKKPLSKTKAKAQLAALHINAPKESINMKRKTTKEQLLREYIRRAVKKILREEEAKPDYLDMDKDGNKKEPMKKAVKDKETKTEEKSRSTKRITKR